MGHACGYIFPSEQFRYQNHIILECVWHNFIDFDMHNIGTRSYCPEHICTRMDSNNTCKTMKKLNNYKKKVWRMSTNVLSACEVSSWNHIRGSHAKKNPPKIILQKAFWSTNFVFFCFSPTSTDVISSRNFASTQNICLSFQCFPV